MSDSLLASPALKPRAGDLYNIDAALTEEERAIRDSVRAFVDEKVLPIIGPCYLDGRFPTELIAEMGQLGFLGANLPEEYGCAGLSNVAYGPPGCIRRCDSTRYLHEHFTTPLLRAVHGVPVPVLLRS